MISIDIPDKTIEMEGSDVPIQVIGGTFTFEHSLKAISKWEMKYHKPFLVKGDKTPEETIYYILCMCIDNGLTIAHLDDKIIQELIDYINSVHTATTIRHDDDGTNNRIITSEVLYAYMASSQVPYTADEWNIERLMMVIGSVAAISSPPKKMTKAEVIEENRKLNAERRAALKKKG